MISNDIANTKFLDRRCKRPQNSAMFQACGGWKPMVLQSFVVISLLGHTNKNLQAAFKTHCEKHWWKRRSFFWVCDDWRPWACAVRGTTIARAYRWLWFKVGWLFSNTNLGAWGWIVVLGVVKRQVEFVFFLFLWTFFSHGGAITCCIGRVALDPRRHRCAAYPLETGRVCHRVALPWLLCVRFGAIGCCSQCWRQRVPPPWLLRCSSSLRTWTFWVGAAFLFRKTLKDIKKYYWCSILMHCFALAGVLHFFAGRWVDKEDVTGQLGSHLKSCMYQCHVAQGQAGQHRRFCRLGQERVE